LPADDPFASPTSAGRAAIVDMLPSLAAVHAAHDDSAWTIDELGSRCAVIENRPSFRLPGRGQRRAPARTFRRRAYGDFD